MIPCDRLMNGERRFEDYKNVVKTKDRKTLSPATAPKNVVAQIVQGTATTAQTGAVTFIPISLFKLSPCRLREVDPIINEDEKYRRHS